MHGTVKYHINYLPDRTTVFSGKPVPEMSPDSPNVFTLRTVTKNPDSLSYYVHNNQAYGWNPDIEQRFGVVDFNRTYCSTTDNPTVFKLCARLPP